MKKLNKLSHIILGSVTLLLSAQPVFGLGLGSISIQSYLNQPLQAEVNINDLGDVSSSEIQVSLASREVFEKAGLDRPYTLSDLSFEVVTRGEDTYLEITSHNSVADPFLSFIVEAKWASGRVLREYTVLLDPVGSSYAHQEVSKSKKTAAKKSTLQPAPKKVSSPVKIASKSYDQKPQADNDLKPGDSYGPVSTEDTLWGIASRLSKGTSANVYQTMLAIVEKNPNSFIRQNIHGLKKQTILALPNASELNQIAKSQAVANVAMHRQAWLHQAVEMAPKPRLTQKTGDIIKPKPLKLVSSTESLEPIESVDPNQAKPKDLSSAGEKINQTMREQLLATQKALDTLESANQELAKNHAFLLEQNQKLTQAIKKKEQNLDPTGEVTHQKTGNTLVSSQLSQSIQDQMASFTKGQEGTKVGLNQKPTTSNLKPNASQTLPKKTATVAPPVVPTTPLIVESPKSPTQSLPWLWIAACLGFVGAGGFTFRYLKTNKLGFFENKRREQFAPVEFKANEPTEGDQLQVDLTDDIKEAFSVFDETSPKQKTSSIDEAQYEVLRGSEALASISAGEDVQEEVDVFIEYKRYEQAEKLLIKHLSVYPEDWSNHAKLLEVYNLHGNFIALKEHLKQLPSDLETKDPEVWHNIQIMLEGCMVKPVAHEEVVIDEVPEAHDQEGIPEAISQEPLEQEHDEVMEPSEVPESRYQASHDIQAESEPEPDHRTMPNSSVPTINLAEKCGVESELKFGLEEDVTREYHAKEQPTMRSISNPQSVESQNAEGDLEFSSSPAQAKSEEYAYLQDKDAGETNLSLAKTYFELGDMTLAKEHIKTVFEVGSDAQVKEAEDLLAHINKPE